MKCDQCGQREAVVYVRKVSGGAGNEARLCAECAATREHGKADGDVALALSRLVNTVAAARLPAGEFSPELAEGETASRRCPCCGALLEEMLESGHAGCAACWSAFGAEFDALREQGQDPKGGNPRVEPPYPFPGFLPRRLAERRSALAEIDVARRLLQAAVDSEDYETAARCRDRLRELESEIGDA